MSNNKEVQVTVNKVKKPEITNEKLGFYFSSLIKIYDPNTKEVLLHKRAD